MSAAPVCMLLVLNGRGWMEPLLLAVHYDTRQQAHQPPPPHSAPLHSTPHHTTPTPHHTTPHHTTPHHTTPHHTTPHHTTPLHTTPHHTTPHHTTPHHTTPLNQQVARAPHQGPSTTPLRVSEPLPPPITPPPEHAAKPGGAGVGGFITDTLKSAMGMATGPPGGFHPHHHETAAAYTAGGAPSTTSAAPTTPLPSGATSAGGSPAVAPATESAAAPTTTKPSADAPALTTTTPAATASGDYADVPLGGGDSPAAAAAAAAAAAVGSPHRGHECRMPDEAALGLGRRGRKLSAELPPSLQVPSPESAPEEGLVDESQVGNRAERWGGGRRGWGLNGFPPPKGGMVRITTALRECAVSFAHRFVHTLPHHPLTQPLQPPPPSPSSPVISPLRPSR